MNDLSPAVAGVVSRVYGEYVEMPGLQLTLKQAQRLFGLGERECGSVLEWLVERRVLMRLPNGTFARAGADHRAPDQRQG